MQIRKSPLPQAAACAPLAEPIEFLIKWTGRVITPDGRARRWRRYEVRAARHCADVFVYANTLHPDASIAIRALRRAHAQGEVK